MERDGAMTTVKSGDRSARRAIDLRQRGTPERSRPSCRDSSLSSHADALAATDLFTTEVWTARGLVIHYVLFVIDHATRAVEIAGAPTNPDSAFMSQVARNLTDCVDGFLRQERFLVPLGTRHLQRAVDPFVADYNVERAHRA